MSKRYERMSKEEVVEVLRKAGGACSECAVPKKFCSRSRGVLGCAGIVYQWLNENIETKRVHRYELIKSPEDLEKFRREWAFMCEHTTDCDKCKYGSAADVALGCFCAFLNDEIEVEE